jgi:hypothetical protein
MRYDMLSIALLLVPGAAFAQESGTATDPGQQESDGTEEEAENEGPASSLPAAGDGKAQEGGSGESSPVGAASESGAEPVEGPNAEPEGDGPSGADPVETGELYVHSNVPGEIYIDGESTGLVSPALVPNVPIGDRLISVQTDCFQEEREVEIRTGLVERSEFSVPALDPEKPPASKVEVRSSPEEAMVFLDGENVGNTPWSSEAIPCGTHSVEIRHFGYLEHKSTIDATPYEPIEMDVKLKSEEYGTLVVKPNPLDTAVSLDGVVQGTGPMTLADIPVGEYTLDFTAEGYDPMQKVVGLRHEQVQTLEISLYPEGTTPVAPSLDMVASSALFAGGVALGYLSLDFYVQGRGYFLDYLDIESDSYANSYYDKKVLPYRNLSIGTGAGSAALLASGVYLWQKQRVSISPTSSGITFFGQW